MAISFGLQYFAFTCTLIRLYPFKVQRKKLWSLQFQCLKVFNLYPSFEIQFTSPFVGKIMCKEVNRVGRYEFTPNHTTAAKTNRLQSSCTTPTNSDNIVTSITVLSVLNSKFHSNYSISLLLSDHICLICRIGTLQEMCRFWIFSTVVKLGFCRLLIPLSLLSISMNFPQLQS